MSATCRSRLDEIIVQSFQVDFVKRERRRITDGLIYDAMEAAAEEVLRTSKTPASMVRHAIEMQARKEFPWAGRRCARRLRLLSYLAVRNVYNDLDD